MKVDNEKRCGVSYLKRVSDINRIYAHWVKTGLSNREIWRRYIYPEYGISERTLYNILKKEVRLQRADEDSVSPMLVFRFDDE